jgi:hypothetical protein
MLPVGVWLRPDEFTREGLGDNFMQIIGAKDDLYHVMIYWDWEDSTFLDEPYDDWKYEDEIEGWDVYQPEDLIVSIFIEGVK